MNHADARFYKSPTLGWLAAVRGEVTPGDVLHLRTRAGAVRERVAGEIIGSDGKEVLVRMLDPRDAEGVVGVRVLSMDRRHRMNVGGIGRFDLPGGGGPDGDLWMVVNTRQMPNQLGHWVHLVTLKPANEPRGLPAERGRPKSAQKRLEQGRIPVLPL